MRIIFCILLSFCASFVNANEVATSNPNQVLHSVAVNTFARISADEKQLEAQPDHIKTIIEEELIPYFDYKYAAYKVMGSHLNNTTVEQRNAFVVAFKSYLINAYGHILVEYDEQEFEILDNHHFKDKQIVSVPVRILDKNNKVTNIAFSLRKNRKTGEWKVFDVIAEGISMLNTKQSEFNDVIYKQGIDDVIELLNKKNSEF